MKNKLSTIFYPYAIWSIIQGVFEVVLSNYTNGRVTLTEVFSLIWQPRAQFWFLYVLFFAFAFAVLLYRRTSLIWVWGGLVVALFFNLFTNSLSVGYLGNMLSRYFVYFALGVLFTAWSIKRDIGTAVGLILAGTSFIAAQWFSYTLVDLQNSVLKQLVYFLLGSLGIASVLVLSQWLVRFKLTRFADVGRYSMVVFLVHVLAGSGCRVILQKVFGVTDVTLHLLVGLIGGLLLPILFFKFCQRSWLVLLFEAPRNFVKLRKWLISSS